MFAVEHLVLLISAFQIFKDLYSHDKDMALNWMCDVFSGQRTYH